MQWAGGIVRYLIHTLDLLLKESRHDVGYDDFISNRLYKASTFCTMRLCRVS